MQKPIYLLILLMLCSLGACRTTDSLLRSASQEKTFRDQYLGQPFYTAMVLQPYHYNDDYLIDLTGKVAETDYEMFRATTEIPLGSLLTITDVRGKHILARIVDHPQVFRILMPVKYGTSDEVAKALMVLVSKEPPLRSVREDIRPVIERRTVTRGMSRHEVYMSWGQPDKVNDSPGSTGFLEEWIYFRRRMHLFLENGFVTNWQQF